VVTESGPTASNIERVTKPEAAEISETRPPEGYILPQMKKRNDDAIGMEMVNALKSSIKSRGESESHDSDTFLLLLSMLDDFKKIRLLKNCAKTGMLNVVQKYQPLLASSAHCFQHETYPNSQRAAYANAATLSSHPNRPSSSHFYHSYDHSIISP
jgi:hypothetical protein